MSNVKERPITLTAEEVRAILGPGKSQMRRPIEPVRGFKHYNLCSPHLMKESWQVWWHGLEYDRVGVAQDCPYGKPGDRLWVRETWANYQTIDYVRRADGRSFSEVSDGHAAYKADGFDTIQDLKNHIRLMSGFELEGVEVKDDKWQPSNKMPRWASRLTLEITELRAERVQDISEEDAEKEGISGPHQVGYPAYRVPGDSKPRYSNPVAAFEALWDSIYGEKHPFDSNPWVWVINFRKIEEQTA